MRQALNISKILLIACAVTVSATCTYAQHCDSSCDDFAEAVCDGCDSSGCADCCNICSVPQWTATASALFLHREDPNSAILGFNIADPTESFNAGDLEFDYQTGFDLTLTRSIANSNAIELRYFGVDHWNASGTVATTTNDPLQFNAAVPVVVNAGEAVRASYTSALHNSEFNLRHSCFESLDLLIGFRYMELNERGSAGLVNAAIPFNYDASIANRLYGGQLGVQALLFKADRISLDAIMKAGVYGNHASQSSSVATNAATLTARGSDDPTSFIGEIGLTGKAWLTDNLAVRSGYQLLWVENVALATEQLAVTDFFSGTGVTASGNVFYHGAFVGMELMF
ncbi:BBP7 family outer membrane beta-barrel protein [Novipirellula sp. SH528]|uniref:BBP7 family outer membrane beta-barrel protein n=1 Tax=Novipirellula sp. SH528 TaxID=3454466 RepID=UPI003FA10CD4